MPTNERIQPTEAIRRWRWGFLRARCGLRPTRPSSERVVALDDGNKKTGVCGSQFDHMFVWNLPAPASCPGSSDWCLEHCYNADERDDVFPVLRWTENWWTVLHRGSEFTQAVREQLDSSGERSAVRLHSSGDFFSSEYVELWRSLASSLPATVFWAYTRSWVIPELRDSLCRLQSLANFQLFASIDPSMDKEPPRTWRRAYVLDGPDSLRSLKIPEGGARVCPEQIRKVDCCASCGFCSRTSRRSVIFYFH